MEMDLYQLLDRLEKISDDHDYPTNALQRIRKEVSTLKICTPMVGIFSSGKSSLLNELLGYNEIILPVDIRPETAVPTELEYVESRPEQATISYYEGADETLSLDEFRSTRLDANQVRKVHIALNNSALAKIPDLLLVDMPGFESGFEAHNRAIDGYVENSMAYLITFAADSGMVLSNSLKGIIRELCQYDTPLIAVITKMDKVDDENEYKKLEERLKESLQQCVGGRSLEWCRTTSRDGKIEQFEAQLNRLQAEANHLRLRHTCKMLLPVCNGLQTHLSSLQKKASLSDSELRVESEKLTRQISDHEIGLQKSEEEFRSKLPECIANIAGEVQQALNGAETGLVAMAMNRQTDGINDQVNAIVRSATVNGVQKYYVPLIEKYIRGIAAADVDMDLSIVAAIGGAAGKDGGSWAASIAAGVASALFLPLGPLGVLLVGALVKWVSDKLNKSKRQEELKNEIRYQLNTQFYPEIMSRVRERLSQQVNDHANRVCEKIKELGQEKSEQLNKTLQGLQEAIQGQETQKKSDLAGLQQDSKEMEEIIHELRNGSGE